MPDKDYSGSNTLSTLILLIKNALNGFAKKEHKTGSDTEYRTMTDNNLTDGLKTNYDNAYSHSTSAHAPSDAQANVIESVKVNGSDLSVEGKAVNIAIPLVSTDISADKDSDAKTASAKAVHSYVAAAIAGANGGMAKQILTSGEYDESTGLPTVTGDENVLYFVPANGEGNNVYNEYMFINGNFEFIGTTETDLTGYVKESDLSEITAEEVNALWASVFGS